MVLIAEREIIGMICAMLVFNKAKYHICDNNEFASYIIQLMPMQDHIALLIFSFFFLFFYLFFNVFYQIYCTCLDSCNNGYKHAKHTHIQNTSHVYSGLAAIILLKHYCTIKYIVN